MRFLLGFFIGGAGGFVGGMLAMLIVFPFLFPPPMVNELVSDDTAVILLETSFRENVDGQDLAHWGRGDVKIYQGEGGKILVEFQPNFEVGAGPNFWLYVNKLDNIDNELDFNGDMERVRVTKIKSFQGSQVYEVSGADFEHAKALTIWCESFGQYIASANLSSS